jgi:hypothetical protein
MLQLVPTGVRHLAGRHVRLLVVPLVAEILAEVMHVLLLVEADVTQLVEVLYVRQVVGLAVRVQHVEIMPVLLNVVLVARRPVEEPVLHPVALDALRPVELFVPLPVAPAVLRPVELFVPLPVALVAPRLVVHHVRQLVEVDVREHALLPVL